MSDEPSCSNDLDPQLPRCAWLLACSVSRKDDSPQSPASVDFLLWHPIQQIRNGEQRRLNTQIQLKSDFVMTVDWPLEDPDTSPLLT